MTCVSYLHRKAGVAFPHMIQLCHRRCGHLAFCFDLFTCTVITVSMCVSHLHTVSMYFDILLSCVPCSYSKVPWFCIFPMLISIPHELEIFSNCVQRSWSSTIHYHTLTKCKKYNHTCQSDWYTLRLACHPWCTEWGRLRQIGRTSNSLLINKTILINSVWQGNVICRAITYFFTKYGTWWQFYTKIKHSLSMY